MLQNKTKENEGLKRKMIELEAELRDSFETALKEKEEDHSKVVQQLAQEKEGLTKKVEEIEPHVAIASQLKQQKESIELTLKSANANHDIEKTRTATLSQENEQLRKAIVEGEARLKSYYEEELALKDKLRQQEVDRLGRELEQAGREKEQLRTERDGLFTVSAEYQSRISMLRQEIERLHSILSNNIAQNKADVELVRATNAALQAQVAAQGEQLHNA
jgi:uncharacterized small protein (DUF1192 family)